jgi:peptidoglycan/xylan/chitin deacetylase (PgdA/CDA1 family)
MKAELRRSVLLHSKRQLGKLQRTLRQWSGTYQRPRAVILLFHSIGNDKYSLPVDRFETYIHYLAEHAMVVSLETLLKGRLSHRQGLTCTITWDDGYSSVHEWALPILKRYNFPATLYLNVGVINRESPISSDDDPGLYPGLRMLTWQQVADLESCGFTLGSHLVHHLDLTSLSRATAMAELRLSRITIEKQANSACLDFAYPWGRASRRTAQWVREAGFRSAVTALHGPLPTSYDPMFIPRIDIHKDYTLTDFEAILKGDWDYLVWYQRVKRAIRLIEY